jgi:hypothetical protein
MPTHLTVRRPITGSLQEIPKPQCRASEPARMGSGAVQVIRVQLAALLLLWCGFTGQGAGQVPTDRYRNVIGWQSRPGEGALNAPS